jgi:hypothetical protein
MIFSRYPVFLGSKTCCILKFTLSVFLGLRLSASVFKLKKFYCQKIFSIKKFGYFENFANSENASLKIRFTPKNFPKFRLIPKIPQKLVSFYKFCIFCPKLSLFSFLLKNPIFPIFSENLSILNNHLLPPVIYVLTSPSTSLNFLMIFP